MAERNGTLSLMQLVTILVACLQAILLWWMFDQTARLRAVELSHGEQKASLAAVQPFASADRIVLTGMATTVNTQEAVLRQTVTLMQEINTMVQNLARQQVDLRTAIERLEQTTQVRGERNGKRRM